MSKNKRPGSRCDRKMMSPKAAKRRAAIHMYWKDVLVRREAAQVRLKARRVECRKGAK